MKTNTARFLRNDGQDSLEIGSPPRRTKGKIWNKSQGRYKRELKRPECPSHKWDMKYSDRELRSVLINAEGSGDWVVSVWWPIRQLNLN